MPKKKKLNKNMKILFYQKFVSISFIDHMKDSLDNCYMKIINHYE